MFENETGRVFNHDHDVSLPDPGILTRDCEERGTQFRAITRFPLFQLLCSQQAELHFYFRHVVQSLDISTICLAHKMNSSDACHVVDGCPGVYVDAFQGRILREKTKDPKAIFILSHYHGDHYQQLPRNFRYQGPAKIHCTPITACLLKEIHEVSPSLVVSHENGSTFDYKLPHCEHANSTNVAKITFYDAHHCPGACIIVFELPNGNVHVHTGDMRYNPTLFQSFPRLQQAVSQNKIDLVYLDTTYSHPKHDFCPQEEAIETIANQTKDLLLPNRRDNNRPGSKTLVLLSCYSIGKEKVLWEVSKRCNQPVYVSAKKLRMLQCVSTKEQGMVNGRDSRNNNLDRQHQDSCFTRDLSSSDIHVIPMGMAGEMWPFFRPNFQKIATYVQDLNRCIDPVVVAAESTGSSSSVVRSMDPVSQRPTDYYNKVVAFIPTGWANASNWNKKNAISTKDVVMDSCDGGITPWTLHVEVRLIGYSEHSSFSELQSFIKYLKPRMVIPTVFSDEVDSQRIVARFRNLLDQTKAQKAFLRSMMGKFAATTNTTTTTRCEHTNPQGVGNQSITGSNSNSNDNNGNVDDDHWEGNEELRERKLRKVIEGSDKNDDDDDDDVVVISKDNSGTSSNDSSMGRQMVETLMEMGFSERVARECLVRCHHDLYTAIDTLLLSSNGTTTGGTTTTATSPPDYNNGCSMMNGSDPPQIINAPEGESMDLIRIKKRQRSGEESKVSPKIIITDYFPPNQKKK